MATDTVTPVVVRIILRYASGALASYGGAAATTGLSLLGAPQTEAILSLLLAPLIAAATEWWYAEARASGGPT